MIEVEAMCGALGELRADSIVIACQTVRRPWHRVSRRPELDILYRGVMGKGSSLGLGLALARPERRVIVLDGDGSLLMNLGTLATIVDAAPENLCLFVFENGAYSGTGGQAIPGADKVSFAGFGRAAGFEVVEEFEDMEPLAAALSRLLAATGPTMVVVKTAPVAGAATVQDDLPNLPTCISRLQSYLLGQDAAGSVGES